MFQVTNANELMELVAYLNFVLTMTVIGMLLLSVCWGGSNDIFTRSMENRERWKTTALFTFGIIGFSYWTTFGRTVVGLLEACAFAVTMVSIASGIIAFSVYCIRPVPSSE